MKDSGQKTEKPTHRRLEKARKDGRFAVSREMVGAAEFLVFVLLLAGAGKAGFEHMLKFTRTLLAASFEIDFTPPNAIGLGSEIIRSTIFPMLAGAAILMACGLAVQLAITRFGFSMQKIAPDLTRWNPVQRVRQLPGQNFPAFVQALVLLPIFLFAAWMVVRDRLDSYLALPLVAPGSALRFVADSSKEFLWKSTLVILALGCIDLFRQKRKYTRELRMSKHEVREETRESEGNPQIKGRIRRIQRDLARRNMMKEVPAASAIIVNPTHYAVALRYETQSMAAPRVVAKGKNYLAKRIRQIATDNQVPIIENPPLAQALYKSVDVGQEIPAQLYRAVAEILAYIYRLMHQDERKP